MIIENKMKNSAWTKADSTKAQQIWKKFAAHHHLSNKQGKRQESILRPNGFGLVNQSGKLF